MLEPIRGEYTYHSIWLTANYGREEIACSIEEGFIQKRRSLLLFRGQNLFNSMPR